MQVVSRVVAARSRFLVKGPLQSTPFRRRRPRPMLRDDMYASDENRGDYRYMYI